MSFTIDKDRKEMLDVKPLSKKELEKEKKKAEKKKAYLVAMSLIQKAGARHSFSDTRLLQQIHDMVCQLGAKCPDNKKAAESVLDGDKRK